jgi:hypothetical protein
MEMNVKKSRSNKNFKTTISSKTYDRRKTTADVESFKHLGSMLTNDGRCAVELNPELLWQKVHLTSKWLFLAK